MALYVEDSKMQSAGGIYVIGGNLVYFGLGAFYWIFVAIVSTPSVYGTATYFLSIATMLSVAGVFGLNTFVMAFSEHDKFGLMSTAAHQLTIIMAVGISVVPILLGMPLISAVLVGEVTSKMTQAHVLARKRYLLFFGYNLFQRSLQLISTAYLYSAYSETGIIIGYGFPLIVLGFPSVILALKGGKFAVGHLKGQLTFILHSFGNRLSLGLRTFFDKIIVGFLFGFQLLGLYQLSFQFFLAGMFLPEAAFQFLVSNESSIGRKLHEDIELAVSGLILTILGVFGFPLLLKWLFPQYVGATAMVRIIAFSFMPATFAWSRSAVFFREKKSIHPFVASSLQALVEISIIIAFGGFLYGIGLGIAILLGQTAMACYLLVASMLNHISEGEASDSDEAKVNNP